MYVTNATESDTVSPMGRHETGVGPDTYAAVTDYGAYPSGQRHGRVSSQRNG